MTSICPGSLYPKFGTIINSIPFNTIVYPTSPGGIPVIKNPVYTNFFNPGLEAVTVAVLTQWNQLGLGYQEIYQLIASRLGVSVNSIQPDYNGVFLSDLLSGNDSILYSTTSSFVPADIFVKFGSPTIQQIVTAVMNATSYLLTITTPIPSLISEIISRYSLGNPALVLPSTPSLASIQSLVPSLTSLGDISNTNMSTLFNVTVSGLGSFPVAQFPLVPNFQSPETEYDYRLSGLYCDCASEFLTQMMTYFSSNTEVIGVPSIPSGTCGTI